MKTLFGFHYSNPSLHGKAIRGVKNLMTSHDLDPRYIEQDAKARVAALYLPILGVVMDTIPQLHQYLPETHDRIQNIGLLEDYQGPHGELFTIKLCQTFP